MTNVSFRPPIPKPPTPRFGLSLFQWAAALGVVAISVVTVQLWVNAYLFRKGESAYRAGDCSSAMAQYDRLIEQDSTLDLNDYGARAKARKGECDRFQAITTGSPSLPAATILLAASDFLNRYPDSALADELQDQVTQRIDQSEWADVATLEVCDRLQSIQNHLLIPDPPTQLPLVMQTCGGVYSEAQQFGSAIATYESFLSRYPNHTEVNAVEAALAKTMVAQANAEGAGEIAPPPLTGYRADGETVVTIRNDSPEAMRIVFSGDDPQFKELPPCEDCETFMGTPPEYCPEKGPEATFTLKPGAYSVLVRSVSDRSVTPFTGEWQLASSGDYYSCFYIVRSPSGQPME